MNSPDKPLRLAIFIDADNTPPHVAEDLFKDIGKLGLPNVKRIYGNTLGLAGWRDVLEKYPLVTSQVQEGKNAADIALIIDAMDFMHRKIFDGFCLVSSDKDFTRLATRLLEEGLTVYGFGKSTASPSFQQACTQFFFIKEKSPKNLPAASKPKPAIAKPATPKPTTKKTTAPKQPTAQKYPTADAIPLITQALAEATKDADGWAPLSAIGSILRKNNPHFVAKDYGRVHLSKLAELTTVFEFNAQKISLRKKAGKIAPAQ